MTETDPFRGLGLALALLRKRAGFASQTEASAVVKIDKGQLSRWENDNPRPTLDNLGRLLIGYGASLADLVAALEAVGVTQTRAEERRPSVEEQVRSLKEAVRRLEERQTEIERRLDQLE
ncbi:MAG TPA: helix-turn-helix transcriptional regulator [Thermoanaerobaculia bacterium]|nr:helix-turn-helix transcriptional regulator [Thermoanaerobaculia bacterium]